MYKDLLFAIGGVIPGSDVNVVERFDGTTWSTVSPMNAGRFGLGVAVYDGYLYAIGGEM